MQTEIINSTVNITILIKKIRYESFNGKKEVSTGYSCVQKYWDKKSECVKKGFSNWVMINHEINKLKN